MAKLKPYSNQSVARVATALYEKKSRTRLSLPAQKLLYGFACNLQQGEELFPIWEINMEDLCGYLGLPVSGKTYASIRNSIREIFENPLEWESDKINPKTGQPHWQIVSWLSTAGTTDKGITIKFSEDAKPFLLGLKEFCQLEPRYFKDFKSPYAMWLYPYLRNVANMKTPKVEFSFDEILKLTYNETSSAYTGKDGAKNVLQRVIGIVRPRGAKVWLPLQDGTGALNEINEKSDLYVTCEVLKSGRKYTGVVFYVNFKEETAAGKRKARKQVYKTHYKTEGRRKSDLKKANHPELFRRSVPYEFFEEAAKIRGISVEQEIALGGYRPNPDEEGTYIKI